MPTPAQVQVRLYGDSTQVPGAKDVFLPAPNLSRYSAEVESDDVIVTTVGMQGWRNTMEDAHAVEFDLKPGVHFFAVFDGHGGIDTALRASQSLSSHVKKSSHFAAGRYAEALKEAFIQTDHEVCNQQLQAGKFSGSTAVVVLLTPTHAYCANVGDSRAVLCRGSKAIDLSEDHKPQLKREHDRVVAAGGNIVNGRVRGMLAMTRALGDVIFKRPEAPPDRQVVSAVPDITVTALNDDDVAIILACDGIWDCITSQELCQFFLEENTEHDDWALMCEHLCEILVAPALHQFGTDNMTILTIRFTKRGLHVGKGVGSPLPAGKAAKSFDGSSSKSPVEGGAGPPLKSSSPIVPPTTSGFSPTSTGAGGNADAAASAGSRPLSAGSLA